jgi:O-antigen ligase
MKSFPMRSHSPHPSFDFFGSKLHFGLLTALLVLLALLGGYSRYDTGLLVVLRPLLMLVAAGFMLSRADELRSAPRVPMLLLAVLGTLIALQLVPLPPAVWTALPERAGYMEAATWIGRPQPWRPLTLVPVLTWNSLMALLPAGTMMIAFTRFNRGKLRFCVAAILVMGMASALLGVLQIGTSAGYFYRNPSVGLPTGFFSNRNHQAVFLASLLPLLAIWAEYSHYAIPLIRRRIVAGAVTTLFAVTILITGSRTGLLLMVLNVAGAGWFVWRAPSSRRSVRGILPLIALASVLAVLTGAAVYLGRGGGISRLASLDAGAEMRVRAWPVLRELVTTYLPWGSGFGTFDPLFRMHEPDALLKPSFFNNAHNDLIELAITGGAPAMLLLAALVLWVAKRSVTAIQGCRRAMSWSTALPVAGSMMAITWLLASLSDYPLRTPLAGALFAFACCVLATEGTTRDARRL